MVRINKHIAFSLLGLFLFPIIYQPVHSNWHHSVKNSQTNQIHYNHSCCSHSQTSMHTYPKGLSEIGPFNENEEQCPVCEYQISINNLPLLSNLNYTVRRIDINYTEVAITRFISSVVSIESPRAPPIQLV